MVLIKPQMEHSHLFAMFLGSIFSYVLGTGTGVGNKMSKHSVLQMVNHFFLIAWCHNSVKLNTIICILLLFPQI